MRRAILTGGTGFVGSWLARELFNNNYHVTLVVRDKERVDEWLKTRVNIIESKSLQESDLGEGDVFYHLAWEGVSTEKKNDISLQISNIMLTIEAMKLAKRCNCKKFIVTGTVAEYVFCENVMDLNAKQTPNDFYGAAKVSSHYFLDVLSRQIKQPYIYAVLPSTYGEGRKDDNILTYTIKMLLNKQKPLYGDLNQLWDFVYVADVAEALRLLYEKGVASKTYGIGSGNYCTLKEYIMCVRDIINPELELGIGERQEMNERTFSSCVNTYDLLKDVGFRPRVGFKEGIERMICYFKNQNT
uniref:NAD-dependent epimerase/dehydratase family protein n=1 Tax=Agathobacter sp. TaxID=2021311 RepID=UPI0040570BC0